jgi:hypothetical protein
MNTSDFIVSIHQEFRVQGGHVLELSGFVETGERRYPFESVAELGEIFVRERRAVTRGVCEEAAEEHARQT